MSAQEQGAPAPIRTTKQTLFFSCDPQQTPLFSVNGNISATSALEAASTFLSTANAAITAAALDTDNSLAWAAQQLVEMAHAIVESAITAVIQEQEL